MSTPGQVIAFYSFKGGTGRSMALANVGYLLAKATRSDEAILLIDWDLEAPGLHRYFQKELLSAFNDSEEVLEKFPGLIDVFTELRERIDQSNPELQQEFDSAKAMLQDIPIEEYIIKTGIPQLHLLKAGRFDGDYPARVAAFDWLGLYNRSPFLLKAFAARLTRDYRYVLVDSRTGLNDTSGICTMLLPEVLVTVFTPNRQSISGVRELIIEAGRYRSQSDDLRPLQVYPLPSRIEASEPALREQWRFGDRKAGIEGFQQAFETAFKEIYALPDCNLTPYFDEVQIQHVPRYAYGEELAVRHEEIRDRFSLTRSYEKFAVRLLEGRPPWVFSDQAKDTLDEAAIALDPALAGSITENPAKKREAAVYLQDVKLRVVRLVRDEMRIKLAERLYPVGVALTAAAAGFAWQLFSSKLGWPSSIPAYAFVIASVAAAPIFYAVQRFLLKKKDNLALSVAEIQAEISSFESGSPPYDDSDALKRFMRRVERLFSRGAVSADRKIRIFICYRRPDTVYHAARMYEALQRRFSEAIVFIDNDSIRPGENYRAVIDRAIRSADVMLVVIGPEWLRSDLHVDIVELEVAEALRRKILTIPVLVDNAVMPKASDLPEDIRQLADRQPLSLSSRRWDADMTRLVEQIDEIRFGLSIPAE
jgi:cellulose biosynthesis protein BcsQ